MNAKQAAKALNKQAWTTSAGFYSDQFPRCFGARVRKGKLELNGFTVWHTVETVTAFRDHNGRPLFTYSPEPQA